MALFNLIYAWRVKKNLIGKTNVKALVPSLTFVGSINALIMNNIEPIFCDVDDTLTIDVSKLKKLHKDIKFLLGVSVYGNLPDVNILKKFARKNNLIFINDSAPSFGAKFKNKILNQHNVDEIYSFHATKIFNSMEGGCVLTNNKTIHNYLARLRDFGQINKSNGETDLPGLNSKMQEISAIVGRLNLRDFKSQLNKRKKIIKNYQNFFKYFEKKNFLKTMRVKMGVDCVYSYFPLILNTNISKFIEFMEKKKINIRRYYTATHDLKIVKNNHKCYMYGSCNCKKKCLNSSNLKVTNIIKNNVVALPIFSEMKMSEQKYLFNAINLFFSKL